MDPRYIAVVAAIVVIGLICAGFMIRCVVRALSIPQCWRCGAQKVRRSHADGPIDTAASVLLLRPFRCSGCLARFYGPRFLD